MSYVNTIEIVNYNGHKPGGDTNGLCDIAEFRHLKAMALFFRDKKGLQGVELYNENRRQIIGEGVRLCIYDKRTIHLITGELNHTLAIEDIGRNPKLRIRYPFPEQRNFPKYNLRQIDLGQPNNEVIGWAFAHFAVNYDYKKLFELLVKATYEYIFR